MWARAFKSGAICGFVFGGQWLGAWDIQFAAKQSVLVSETFLTPKSYLLSKTRFEWRAKHVWPQGFKMSIEGHGFDYWGNYLRTAEWRHVVTSRLAGMAAFDGEKRWRVADDHETGVRLYRAELSYRGNPIEFKLGRSRHGFGGSRIFLSPFDRIDELPPIAGDEYERLASDGAAFAWTINERLRLHSGYLWPRSESAAPGAPEALSRPRGKSKYRSFARLQFLAAEGFETAFLAGQLEPRARGLGASFNKTMAQGELRWEAVYLQKKKERLEIQWIGLQPLLNQVVVENNFSRHLISWEKAYAHDWVLALEYFHNGIGQKDPGQYDVSLILQGEDLYLGRDYAGVSVKKTINPLWSTSVEAVISHTDGSWAVYPGLRYLSPGSRLEISFKPALFFGSAAGEFGLLHNRFYFLAGYYF